MSGQHVSAAWERANRILDCNDASVAYDMPECPSCNDSGVVDDDRVWAHAHFASLALDGLTVAQVTREERRRG